MNRIRLYCGILIFIFSGCQIVDPLITNKENEPYIFIDYSEDENEIYLSVALDIFEGISDTVINSHLTWLENEENIVGCIENDSLLSADLNSIINVRNSNCLYNFVQLSGCIDESALNYDSFAIIDENNCIYEGDWQQFKFGNFDKDSYSFPVYLITSSPIQWFQFDIIGLNIDSLVSSIASTISFYENKVVTTNYIFPALASGVHEVCRIFIPKPPISYQINLNDKGVNGDMIIGNQVYHSIFKPTSFISGEYEFNIEFSDINGEHYDFIEEVNLNYNFNPKILDVEMPVAIMLHDSLWTALEFFVKVFDANNNIDHVKYLINTSKLTSDYYSDTTENIFLNDPSWIMNYNNYVEKNTYRYKAVIPMRPAKNENPEEEGKTGEAKFRFNIYDSDNLKNNADNELQFETSIMLLKCGDDICSEEFENEQTCLDDCGQ